MSTKGRGRGAIVATEPLIVEVLKEISAGKRSDHDVAARSGVGANTISKLRTGYQASIYFHSFVALADAVGFNVVLVRK